MESEKISERFRVFAVTECEGSSELYKELSLQIAKDEEMLKICLEVQENQPVPNLLLGSVHYLLLQGSDHELKNYYPSIVTHPRRDNQLFETFKEFCLENRKELEYLLKNKLVQTNEVRRCAYLYPVFSYIYQKTDKPLSLIEIGSSAGLQLLWDRYSYSYGTDYIYGKRDSSVHLSTKVREGEFPQNLLLRLPQVHNRIGIDLNVSDLSNEEDYLWLKALIWPEHKERYENFENAVAELRKDPPRLLEGDGVTLLPEIVENTALDTSLCIFHTHVANQLPAEVKEKLLKLIEEIGEQRDVFHIYNNMEDRLLHIDSILSGRIQKETIGDTDGHGRWFDWKLTGGTYRNS